MAIGYEPTDETVILTLGADFFHTITPPTGFVFQSGTEVYICFYEDPDDLNTEIDRWDANVDPDKASWAVQSEVADAIEAGVNFRIYISYPDLPTSEYAWYVGTVERRN